MLLSVKGLSVAIKGHQILKNISLNFTEEKRTAIIGPNGAGKSTLLRSMVGIRHDYEGQVLLNHVDTRKIGTRELAKSIAILPQGAAAPPDTTVRRLVSYGRFPYRSVFGNSDVKKDREAIEWAMRVTHVEDFGERQIDTLSGGERQRAFLAMTLAQQPKILLLDEPTTYLDIAHQLEVMNIVTEVNRRYGITVIMVLHDINHALQFADEIVIIKNHGIYGQGTPEKLMTVETLAEVFGVRADRFINQEGHVVLSPVGLVGKR